MGAALFCDQNFLIAASDAGPSYESKIIHVVSREAATLAVGLWTLVEIARARDEKTMIEIAALLDRLRPLWLPERRSLQRYRSFAHWHTLRPIWSTGLYRLVGNILLWNLRGRCD